MAGNYVVTVSVDNPSPSPGSEVKFTIGTYREKVDRGIAPAPPVDLEVAIEMTDGLSVSGTPTVVSGRVGIPVPASVKYISVNDSNGVFNVGTLKGPDVNNAAEPIYNSVTLPVRVSSNAVVNGQCLTATLTGNPPPGTGPHDDDISDNVAKLCLSAAGTLGEPLPSGQVEDAFNINIYPCVGNTDSPCGSTDDVRVRAIGEVGGAETILPQGTALIQIPDKLHREYDSSDNSVNSGDIVSWRIPLVWDPSELNDVHAQWSNLRDGFTAGGVNGGTPPGKVHVRAFEGTNYALIYKMTSATGWTGVDTVGYNPVASGVPVEYIAEFEKLGRYKIEYTAKLTRATRDGDEDCDPDTANPPVNQRFCASETYTFHFGPIADLAVESGGASSHVAADQNALSIIAVNNGPDEPSVGARVTGLPIGAEVIRITQGSYSSSTGVWNTGRLRVRDYYRSAGISEPTLVLGASAGDTASVRIASAKKYEVCVGPKSNPGNLAHTTKAACEAVTDASWNSVPVYDHKPGNNTATIRAARGTGGRPVRSPGTPGAGAAAPGNPTATKGTTTVKWDPVGLLYGIPVVKYEVQEFQQSDWRLLDRVTTHNQYAVMQPRGTSYRVRAVNANNVAGSWSVTTAEALAALAGPPLNLRTQADGNNAIDVLWDAPDDTGGSAITGYAVQWSPKEPGSWRNAGSASASALTYKHRGLSVGAVNYYRVAARNSGGLGLWSDPVMGQTVSGAPNAPNLTAKALSDYEIELTWNKPADNGQPITGYQLEWSSDSPAVT
ncbi:MAG: fibronectin type III domain-containing protein [Chloroflexi bacterium]|nr:fibronectin type III domain-containing protein [Chloroflexota bacterium]